MAISEFSKGTYETRAGFRAEFVAELTGIPCPIVMNVFYTLNDNGRPIASITGRMENYYASGMHSNIYESPLDLVRKY